MRGTTPSVTFTIPLKKEMIAKAKITFKQDNEILLTKHTRSCTIEDGKISTSLTREETLLFPNSKHIKMQLEIETPAGQSHKTRVYTIYSSELLSEEALQ